MLYCYKEVCDEFGNRLVIRVCRPARTLEIAKRQLEKQENGEIRDANHRLVGIKRGPDTRWVHDVLLYTNSNPVQFPQST